MEELLTSPLAYWAAIIGIGFSTALVISSAFFMIATAFRVMNLLRAKNYKRKIGDLLENQYYHNVIDNPEVSRVAFAILSEVDRARADRLEVPTHDTLNGSADAEQQDTK